MSREPGGQLVEREFLTLPVWDQLDAQTAETVARAIERCLPDLWTFQRVAWHACGDQKRHIAFFARGGIEFALVPGGDVTLGYDPQRPDPSVRLLDQWREEARAIAEHHPEWADMTWKRYLSDVLSPLRSVRISPFLIAVQSQPRTHSTGSAERDALAAEGFVLPTADEWEFACSGGSRSVWHWGDDPVSGAAEVNAFGLEMSHNTYNQEALEERDHFRGGDGGQRAHGGCCELESFVPLASWFPARGADATQEDWWQFTRYRRVSRLPEAIFG